MTPNTNGKDAMNLDRPPAPLRTLMGPGPSDIHPAVYRALTSPVIGHLDPAHLAAVGRVGELLRPLFGTANRVTNATPGTGTSGMEACVANLVGPGDNVLCCVHGYFGNRIVQMCERQEAEVTRIDGEWGSPSDPAKVEAVLKEKEFKVITVVHAETSTGVLQPMDDIARLAKEHGAMILLDTVTSLGGIEVQVDAWGVDAAYSCSQKCIGCPPGMAPVTFSDRALAALEKRATPVRSWYLDIQLLDEYWGDAHAYHHTSSSTMNYGLLEALLLIHDEGIESRFARHLQNHRALVAGIEAMGLEMHVAPEHRLPTLNTVRIPDGVDDMALRGFLLNDLNLEIGGGLGDLKGKVWRVGLMGYSSSLEKILFFLSSMSVALKAQGVETDLAAGQSAAMKVLEG